MAAANRVSDCRPLPPTPTNKALPPGDLRTRDMRERCSSKYLNHERKYKSQEVIQSRKAAKGASWDLPKHNQVHLSLVRLIVLVEAELHDVGKVVDRFHFFVQPIFAFRVHVHVIAEYQRTHVILTQLSKKVFF